MDFETVVPQWDKQAEERHDKDESNYKKSDQEFFEVLNKIWIKLFFFSE